MNLLFSLMVLLYPKAGGFASWGNKKTGSPKLDFLFRLVQLTWRNPQPWFRGGC